MKKINKIGQMTSSQLVKIILLIVGFVILMMVFPTLLNEDEINRETCHTSVILRGTLPDTFNLKKLTPLKCQTVKFCITDKVFGKSDCEEFGGEKFETVRVSKDKNKIEEEINRFIARELASCWAMMGQGKVQIFTQKITTKKRCSICSRIAFDKSLKDELGGKVKGLGDYLLTREVPNQDVSYWKYLAKDLSFGNYDETLDGFSTEEKAIVFMEATSSNWDIWLKSLPIAIGGGVGGAAVGTVVGAGIGFMVAGPPGAVVGAAGGKYAGIAVGVVGGEAVGFVYNNKGKKDEQKYKTGWSFGDYNSETLKDLECSSFESIS